MQARNKGEASGAHLRRSLWLLASYVAAMLIIAGAYA